MIKETLEKRIKELNDYFVSKLLSGDYEVKSVDQYKAVLLVNGEYQFPIWIGNTYDRLRVTGIDNDYFLNLYFTKVEQKSIYQDLKTIQNNMFTRDEIIKLNDKLNKLKASQNE